VITPPTKLDAEGMETVDPSVSLKDPEVSAVAKFDTDPPDEAEFVLVLPLGDDPPEEPPPTPPPSVNKVPVDEPANCVLVPLSAL
jgi:hypothetical protein